MSIGITNPGCAGFGSANPATVTNVVQVHRGPHVTKTNARTGRRQGAHLKKADARTPRRRGAHLKGRGTRSGAHGLRRRSWAALGAVLALVLGVVGGAANAYFTTSTGSGTGSASAGSAVTITVASATGAAALFPGGTSAASFTLTNPNLVGDSFSTVAAGASIVSSSPSACPTSNLMLPTLPFTFSPAVRVGAKTTSAAQSIASFVMLSSSAPSACQGVTFTVTFTLLGTST